MGANDALQRIFLTGIVPVIALDRADKAVPLARALAAGGLSVAEVTFRTSAAEEAIRQISENCPDVLVGAGTVLSVEQCERAMQAGAQFIVSPGYSEELVAYCTARHMPILPGCANASDMTRAVNAGLKAVKFFPAEQSGGVAFLKALAPVMPLQFVPTGGVNVKNLAEYMSFERVAACGGTWMVKKELVAEERWPEITALCREAVNIMLGFSLAHVGVNCETEAQAAQLGQTLSGLFDLPIKDGHSSVMVGGAVECTKTKFPGVHGHIAFAVSHVARAVYHLRRQGVAFDESTATYDEKGELKAIYLQGDFGGFAIHLVRK